MTGMLVGVAALSAWGLHRFHSLTANLPTPLPFGKPKEQFDQEFAVYRGLVDHALLTEYQEIFLITSVGCGVAAVIALLISSQEQRVPAGGS
jgi:hypothetical protein